MRQLFLAAIMACVLLSQASAVERTDVTAQFVRNASFENDLITTLSPVNNSNDGLRGYTVAAPSGWTVTNSVGAVSLLVTTSCYTDNNFGLVTIVPDGQQVYYQRVGWTSGISSLRQTIEQLPKGKYQLSMDYRSGYVNQATSSFELVAGNIKTSLSFLSGTKDCFTTMKWETTSVVFEQSADGPLAIGTDMTWLSGGSCVMFDNVRLYRLPDDYVITAEPTEIDVDSPTEGVVDGAFVAEQEMKADLLKMLANFATYLVNDFQECQYPNSLNEACGCFKGENTMANDERGVRPNADLSMICAFLVKYGKPAGVTLPTGVTWEKIEEMAMKSLIFSYSTHKANKLKVCAGNTYWGSTSTSDAVWESSLWAMSVAYSAFFQWNKLTDAQKNYVYQLLKAECNYELNRSIPTGYAGDTKAEENGWEADVLAVTLGLFPNDELAPQWFARLREFAINSYSQKADATDATVIDPDYDQKTVKDLYRGQNLYDDFTLQNHNYFHTSYQNVVIQELGEAALALKLFQQELYGEEKWKTNALMHNNDKVMSEVLYWLALADGELAMPNGNDWSLFLYDQITSYSTNACFLRDPHALMLENLAYKMIKARQTTTADGSWLLRADVGARRMGVEAHRVMMTWLMHEVHSTADMKATSWADFNHEYSQAKVFTSQNIVRAATDSRFTCFSWSKGLQSYTGYIAANSVDKNKIIVPFRANNTGNFLGWYEVDGKKNNATPVVSGIYDLRGNSFVMNGELNTNDASLNHRFAIYSTPGNAVIYMDYIRANQNVTIAAEKGGLLAVSVDELTKTKRTFYTSDNYQQLDGSAFTVMSTPVINIDNALSIVTLGNSENRMAFGERANNNSVNTAKLYAFYNNVSRSFKQNDVVGRRAVVYYSNAKADSLETLHTLSSQLVTSQGWNGTIAADPDATHYLFLANFAGDTKCMLNNVCTMLGSPIFTVETTISVEGSTATFEAEKNHSVVNTLKLFVVGQGVTAIQDANDSTIVYIRNDVKGKNAITVYGQDGGQIMNKQVEMSTKVLKIYIRGGELLVEEAAGFPGSVDDITEGIGEIKEGGFVASSHRPAPLVYDLQGHQLSKPATHGIYVQQGKKMVR